MISSMTGFGKSEAAENGITASVELKSVNNRFLDVTARMPRSLSHREKDVKDIVRTGLSRGSVSVFIRVERSQNNAAPLRVNKPVAKAYHRLLDDLRKTVKLRETVKLEHLITFTDIFEPLEEEDGDTQEWELVDRCLRDALKSLNEMRANEGRELATDLRRRIQSMEVSLARIEEKSVERVPEERKRLLERVSALVSDPAIIDQKRLELEVTILADKLDVTEECVRSRSHHKFFLKALEEGDAAGRKLNFLIQEMNREANTIGSKSNDAEIAHLVVGLKEELEKIREQLQNIE